MNGNTYEHCDRGWMPGAHLLGMSPASSDPRTRRRTVALIAAGIVLLLLAGVGIYGLLTGPRTTTNTGPDSEPGQAATPPTLPPTAPKPPHVASVPRATVWKHSDDLQ